jgi:hypothetical protein
MTSRACDLFRLGLQPNRAGLNAGTRIVTSAIESTVMASIHTPPRLLRTTPPLKVFLCDTSASAPSD